MSIILARIKQRNKLQQLNRPQNLHILKDGIIVFLMRPLATVVVRVIAPVIAVQVIITQMLRPLSQQQLRLELMQQSAVVIMNTIQAL